jgi:hypothetical protein
MHFPSQSPHLGSRLMDNELIEEDNFQYITYDMRSSYYMYVLWIFVQVANNRKSVGSWLRLTHT